MFKQGKSSFGTSTRFQTLCYGPSIANKDACWSSAIHHLLWPALVACWSEMSMVTWHDCVGDQGNTGSSVVGFFWFFSCFLVFLGIWNWSFFLQISSDLAVCTILYLDLLQKEVQEEFFYMFIWSVLFLSVVYGSSLGLTVKLDGRLFVVEPESRGAQLESDIIEYWLAVVDSWWLHAQPDRQTDRQRDVVLLAVNWRQAWVEGGELC